MAKAEFHRLYLFLSCLILLLGSGSTAGSLIWVLRFKAKRQSPRDSSYHSEFVRRWEKWQVFSPSLVQPIQWINFLYKRVSEWQLFRRPFWWPPFCPGHAFSRHPPYDLRWQRLKAGSHWWLDSQLVAGLVNGPTRVEKKRFSAVHALTRGTFFSFVWRKGLVMSLVWVPWFASFFLFFKTEPFVEMATSLSLLLRLQYCFFFGQTLE